MTTALRIFHLLKIKSKVKDRPGGFPSFPLTTQNLQHTLLGTTTPKSHATEQEILGEHAGLFGITEPLRKANGSAPPLDASVKQQIFSPLSQII